MHLSYLTCFINSILRSAEISALCLQATVQVPYMCTWIQSQWCEWEPRVWWNLGARCVSNVKPAAFWVMMLCVLGYYALLGTLCTLCILRLIGCGKWNANLLVFTWFSEETAFLYAFAFVLFAHVQGLRKCLWMVYHICLCIRGQIDCVNTLSCPGNLLNACSDRRKVLYLRLMMGMQRSFVLLM